MSYESNLSNIIIRLKEAKNNQPTLTLQKISGQTGVSLTTVARIFAPDSENHYFKYESIQPIAAMLLGLNDLDMGNEEEKALKAILQYKESEIRELECEIDVIKYNYETKIELIRKEYTSTINYLKNQITTKDEFISKLLSRLESQDELYKILNQQYLDVVSKTFQKE